MTKAESRRRFKIISYDEPGNYHVCTDLGTGEQHRVDFFVGDQLSGETRDSVIDKIVSVEWLQAFLELAQNPQIEAEAVNGFPIQVHSKGR